MTSLRESLKKRLIADYAKAPKKFWNKNNLEMKWSDKEKLYIGVDDKNREWIAALQHTTIPIFSIPCPNLVRKGNIEIECNAPNCVDITQNGSIKCRKCDKPFTPKFNIPESSKAFEIFNNLDK